LRSSTLNGISDDEIFQRAKVIYKCINVIQKTFDVNDILLKFVGVDEGL
jgi:hypothetical protein